MGGNIRSFIAIELPQDLKNKINDYLNQLKILAPQAKWVKNVSLHITLKFLGDQREEKVDNALTSLTNLPDFLYPFKLTVSGFGAFPGDKRPKVFWLGIHGEEPLFRLQAWIEQAMEPLGFEKERRRFFPHLTLGRVKFQQDFTELWAFAEANPFPFFPIRVDSFVLMRSFLKPQGAEYRVLQKYSLHK